MHDDLFNPSAPGSKARMFVRGPAKIAVRNVELCQTRRNISLIFELSPIPGAEIAVVRNTAAGQRQLLNCPGQLRHVDVAPADVAIWVMFLEAMVLGRLVMVPVLAFWLCITSIKNYLFVEKKPY
jgi:hypothetical protein